MGVEARIVVACFVALVVAGCGDGGRKGAGQRSSTPAAAPDVSDLDVSRLSPVPGVPTLQEAPCPGKAAPWPKVKRHWPPFVPKPFDLDEHNMHKLTLDAKAGAVCNDGTPGVIYVRRGRGDATRKWIVHLQGGGSCRDYASCLERKCMKKGGGTPARMSSRWAPEILGGWGVSNPRPEHAGRAVPNAFGDYNFVLVYYCSSDGHTGQKATSVLEGENGEKMALSFQGHRILEQTIAQLKAGPRSDDGKMRLPSVDKAELVILSGVSAGSNAVKANADWFHQELRASNPDVDVRAVGDATFFPRIEEKVDDYPSLLQADFKMVMAHQSRFIDASCLAAHTDDAWRCGDPMHVLHEHVTTPYFQHMDYVDGAALKDELAVKAYGGKKGFAQGVRDGLQELANAKTTSEEGASIRIAPSVFGTTCGQHVWLSADAFFFGARVELDGKSHTFHDLLAAWVGGAPPRAVLPPAKPGAMKCPKRQPHRL